MRKLIPVLLTFFMVSCGDDTLPKPKAFLSLTYAKPTYKKLPLQRPYVFEYSSESLLKDEANNWLKVLYPKQKASLDITYRVIDKNLKELLTESEKLVFKHTVKAEQIVSNNYVDAEKKVYGTLHEISGNAASQIQFHITDSVTHFMKGALYFKTRPNFDSVLPAVDYIKKDILHLMETLKWKK